MTQNQTGALAGAVQRTILDNGIRVVTERMPFVRSVALGVWVRAGSGDETLDNNGIAHFLEHMFFKGTTRRTAKEIAQSLESLGGGLNGSTGKEVSVYSAHVLDEHVEIAVDVLADLIQNPKFETSDIELEKQVVLAEMAHAKEDPEELTFDNFYQNMFPHHPLGYFIYGSEENIVKFSQTDLENFRATEYTPDRMVVAAAGNVKHDEFVRHVTFHFSNIKPHEAIQTTSEPLQQLEQFVHLQMDGFQQAHICLGVRTFGYGDKRRYALALFDVLLGGGMSSRLFQNIREKYGFAYSVFSFSDMMSETGILGSYIACDTKKIDDSIHLLQLEIDKIKNGDLTDHEVDMVKSQVRGNLILGLENSGRRMKKIGESELYGMPHRSLDEIVSMVDNVSKHDIEHLAHELFVPNNTSITILSP
jgi:predicted Zn-dependent peptidase